MKKEKDEGLDDLFKKGLADPVSEAAFRDADWDAMEQMLDKRKRRPAILYWLPYLSGVAALALLFLGWMLFKPDAVKVQKPGQVAAIQKPTPANTKTDQQKENTGTSGGHTRQAADSSKQNNPAAYANTPGDSKHGRNGKSFFNTLSVGGARRGTGTHAADLSGKPAVAPADNTQQNLAVANNTAQPNTAVNSTLATNAPQKINGVDTTVKQNVIANNVSKVDSSANPTVANTVTPPTAPKSKKPAIKSGSSNRPQFAFGVLASSNLNGVGSLQESKLGGNFALRFSMTLSKWTVSTGASYAIAPYNTSFNNYHTNYQFPANPTGVSANCRMLDIPLNINYQVYNKHNNKFTVGSGLSSYIMLREDYNFSYAGSYPTGPTSYSVINKNRNFLSIVNLDVTYEHRINSNVGLLIEPYYKIPLADVGASQVRLQTAGVAVGFNVNLNSFTKH